MEQDILISDEVIKIYGDFFKEENSRETIDLRQKDYFVEMFVAMGGNTDKTGKISLSKLEEYIEKFELTINVKELISGMKLKEEGFVHYDEFCDILNSEVDEENFDHENSEKRNSANKILNDELQSLILENQKLDVEIDELNIKIEKLKKQLEIKLETKKGNTERILVILDLQKKQKDELIAKNQIFGKSLKELSKRFNTLIPPIISRIINYIELNSLNKENLFIKEGDSCEVERLEEMIDSGMELNFENEEISEKDYTLCDLLKKFIEKLPEPIIPDHLLDDFISTINDEISDKEKFLKMIGFIKKVEIENQSFFMRLLDLLVDLSNQNSPDTLASIFGPLLFRKKNDELFNEQQKESVIKILSLLISNKQKLSDEIIPIIKRRKRKSPIIENRLLPYMFYAKTLNSKNLDILFTPENLELYKGFNEPDNDSNIIVDETGVVKAATLDKLILRLTAHKGYDTEMLIFFLLTYRSFTTPEEFLNKLILRFNTPPPDKDISCQDFQKWYNSTLLPIRLRICQIINHWLEKYFYDFREDEKLRQALQDFINDLYKCQMSTVASKMMKTLQKMSRRKDTFTAQQIQEFKDKSSLELQLKEDSQSYRRSRRTRQYGFSMAINQMSVGSVKELPLIYFKAEDIAEQLTLINFNYYEKLRPKEFLNQNWTTEFRKKKAPNIYRMIQRSNKVGQWVATEIITTKDLELRAETLKKFIKVAKCCEQLQNYNLLVEIIAGLNSNPIFRLKKTFKLIPSEELQIFKDLQQLVSPINNYKNLRRALKCATQPCIPYIGMYLTDLMFIEEGNKDFKDNLINFSKRRLIGEIIKEIQLFQQTPYAQLSEIPELKRRLMHLPSMDMDKLYEMSLEIEPRK